MSKRRTRRQRWDAPSRQRADSAASPHDGMTVTPLERDTAAALLRSRIASRNWWVIGCFTPDACDLAIAVEERYYLGDRNEDYDLITVLNAAAVGVIVLAHKRHMSAAQLAAVMTEIAPDCAISAARLERQDILFPIPPGHGVHGTAALTWFAALMAQAPTVQ